MSRSFPLFLMLFSLIGLPCAAQVQTGKSQDYQGFTSLRNFLLNEIGGAKKRVWLVTDYLTDGELVSSLYVTKYRKVDVAVRLGQEGSRKYMSRLRYLKRQNIPVSIRPPNFFSEIPSLILIDNKLFKIDGDLNFLEQSRRYRVTQGGPAERNHFEVNFLKSRKNPKVAVAPPVPLVGKSGHNMSRPKNKVRPTNEIYNYDQTPRQRSAPMGVAKRLPGKTVYQKRGKRADVIPTKREKKAELSFGSLLDPVSAREPLFWSPRSPESF